MPVSRKQRKQRERKNAECAMRTTMLYSMANPVRTAHPAASQHYSIRLATARRSSF